MIEASIMNKLRLENLKKISIWYNDATELINQDRHFHSTV